MNNTTTTVSNKEYMLQYNDDMKAYREQVEQETLALTRVAMEANMDIAPLFATIKFVG